MTRQSRLILVLVVIAAAGVLSLAFVANQYRKALTSRPAELPADATRRVDGFLAARQALRAGAPTEDTYRGELSSALAKHGMTIEDYVAVRSAWRAMRNGSPIHDRSLAAAFEARPNALADGALGGLESLDDAIR